MEKNIASARISKTSSSLLKELNDSLPFDKILYKEDIEGSLAHALMLKNQKILSNEDYEAIFNGLKEIEKEIENGLVLGGEDIHMAIEGRLTQKIGDAGKRLHTGRSRNDQVAFDFRKYVQKNNLKLSNLLLENIKSLLEVAKNHTETLIPGMTHLQHAQPINFAYHLLAYCSMFKRDYERFISSYSRNNISPLGCAALAGTPYPIDRELTSTELGFNEPSLNCLDTVSDRDFALEILFNISTMMMHISRLSEELILWSSSEFGWIILDDRHATGSSIMPQKKNPDIPELLRGKTGRVNGNLISLLTVMKGLPLAYNKDTQEDKEGVFDSIKTASLSLEILNEMMPLMKINSDKMEKACLVGHLCATDIADYLVTKKGFAFRDAYHKVGDIVNFAQNRESDVTQLSLEELKSIEPKITEDIKNILNNRASMNARNSQGGTSTTQTKKQIKALEEWVNSL